MHAYQKTFTGMHIYIYMVPPPPSYLPMLVVSGGGGSAFLYSIYCFLYTSFCLIENEQIVLNSGETVGETHDRLDLAGQYSAKVFLTVTVMVSMI